MAKTVIAKNITASGITLGDLSGHTIPVSGTTTLSDLFYFDRLVDALDLRDYITASGIVINDGMGDLPTNEALRYLSYEDATSVQNIPIADPSEGNLEDGFTMRYDEGEIAFDFDTFRFTDLAEITLIDGTYYVTNASGISIPLNQKFYELGDTPATYSGAAGYLVSVTASGLEFKSVQDVNNDAGIFGTYYYYESSEAEYSTTSTSFQEKISMSLENIPAGNYRIAWYYEWTHVNGNRRFIGRVQIDDTTTIMEHDSRPTSNNNWSPASGFYQGSLISGDHSIDLDWKTSQNNKTAKIRRARIEVWRVS